MTTHKQRALEYAHKMTDAEVQEFMDTNDQMLWVEWNVLDYVDCPGINTDKGEAVCEAVELYLYDRYYREPLMKETA